jgi:hypothetical protein
MTLKRTMGGMRAVVKKTAAGTRSAGKKKAGHSKKSRPGRHPKTGRFTKAR